jgi:hypothetical protein
MAAQVRTVSSTQYWLYRLTNIPTPMLLTFDIILALVIVFTLAKPIQLVEEWYPGSSKTWPSPLVASYTQIPSTAAIPTVVVLPTPVAMPVVAQQPQPVRVEIPQPLHVIVEEPTVVIPTADKEATVQAWLAAPPGTPTSSPAPGEPGWVESFQQPPECNLFIGYVGPKRDYCVKVYAQQTAEAGQ